MPLTNGEQFNGFRILGLLGTGGMGEVYLVQHPRLPRRDALKVLPAALSTDTEFRERFTREADLAATLFHPHIVGVHDRGEFEGQLWISMDYVNGTDAGRLLHDHPAGLPWRDVVDIVSAVADALDYAHHSGLLHRDVKPGNILLAAPVAGRRRILLADFGIARDLTDSSSITRTNMAIGTVSYAAPEQLTGRPMDGRVDQYALAVMTYQLLTGTLPFDDPSAPVVMSHHLNTPPPSLRDTRPELASLDPIFAIAMAKDPGQRFPRCGDFARAIAEHLGRLPPRPGPALPPTQAPPRAPRSTALMPAPVPDGPGGPAPQQSAPAGGALRWPLVTGALVAIAVFAALLLSRPWQHDDAATEQVTPTSTSAAPAITFDGMREFVTGYYAELPAGADDAWTKLDAGYQQRTGLRDYRNFWASVGSVSVGAVVPQDDSSVVATLTYVMRNGTSMTEQRWFRITLVDGELKIGDSEVV